MTTLIRTEWLKMRKYNAFWWIMGLTAVSYPGIIYILYKIYEDNTKNNSATGQAIKAALGNPFSFPEAWHTVAFFSSCFVFIPAVVVIMLICNEYSFKTHRQNVIDGWSRSNFITSKMLDILIISLFITALYAIVAYVTGVANQERLIKTTWDQVHYIGLFALQTFSQLTVAFLMGFLLRKAFLALGLFLIYFMILENLLVGYLDWKKLPGAKYMPLELSDRMIPKPAFWGKMDIAAYNKSLDAIPQHILLTVIFTAIIWGICYRINNKRDLK